MGAFYFKQPNGKFGRFSSVVDTVTHFDMTKEELHQDMIDRFGKYDYVSTAGFEDFVNQTGRFDGRHDGFYLHDFDEVPGRIMQGNETTKSAQKLLMNMGVPKEEAELYYFMPVPADDDKEGWRNYDSCLKKKTV